MRNQTRVEKFRRILRPVGGESGNQQIPLLINSLTAFNFRPPLNFQFPGESKRKAAAN
jgi:hypothetical protein